MDREAIKSLVRLALRARSGIKEASAPVSDPQVQGRQVVTEKDVIDAAVGTKSVRLAARHIVTPLARETAARLGVRFADETTLEPTVSAASGGSEHLQAPAAARCDTGCAAGVVALGSDHGGFGLKEILKGFLENEVGVRVLDFGTFSTAAVDYPDFAHQVAAAVGRGEACRGIIVDGVGVGSCMAANRHPNVRAAAVQGILEVVNAREHNDANVLCLGGRMIGDLLARALVSVFLTTAFAGGRHQKRVEKIERGGGASKEVPCTSHV